MATFPIKPLDGADGYLRWKELVLLGLNTVGVAHVLSDDPPPSPAGGDGSTQAASKKQRERDDGVCRGHILGVLSDRLLPVYIRHGTARALWEAVERTYKPDSSYWELMFEELEFGEDETLRERVARAEALAIAKSRTPKPCDESVSCYVCMKVPDVAEDAITEGYGNTSMDALWRSAHEMERVHNCRQVRVARQEKEDMVGTWSSGQSGHLAKKRRW